MKSISDLGPIERGRKCDRALIVTETAAREKLAQPEAQRLAVVKPPVERFALRMDAIASAKLD